MNGTEMLITIISGLLIIVGYFLKRTMDELQEIKSLATKTKSELDVLTKDHNNKHEFMTEKFDDLKDSIIVLTREIKELTKEIKK